MSFADDEEFYEVVTGGHHFASVTAEAVSSALKGFTPPLLPGKDMGWLAMAIRRSLGIAVRDFDRSPKRTSNVEIRTELERLAGVAGSAWTELFLCDHAAEAHLCDHSWRDRKSSGGTDIGDGIVIAEPSDFLRFKAAVRELDWVSSFLREAAKTTKRQRGPWRQSEEKGLRVERAQYLAPIFETAFGVHVSANNFPNDVRHKAPTSFMDFYQRVVALAFGQREATNLAEVVKAACRLHRQRPATFGEGLIPGL